MALVSQAIAKPKPALKGRLFLAVRSSRGLCELCPAHNASHAGVGITVEIEYPVFAPQYVVRTV